MIRIFILISFFTSFLLSKENLSCKYDFNALLQKAYDYHPSIKMAQEAIKGYEEGVNQASWNYYPTPSIDISRSSKGMETTYSLTQPLYTGGELDANYELSILKKDESLFSEYENKLTLADNIMRALYSYNNSVEQLNVMVKTKKELEKLGVMLLKRIDSGISSLSDQKLLESRLEKLKSDIQSSEANKDIAKMQLEILTGEKNEGCFLNLEKKYLENVKDRNLYIKKMFDNNPALKKIDLQIKQAEQELIKAKSVLYPKLSVVAEHTQGSLYNDSSLSNDVVYFSLKATPGAGLSSLSNIESYKINLSQKKLSKITKESELLEEYSQYLSQYYMVERNIDKLVDVMRYSSSVYQAYQKLFLIGQKQWLDLVNTSNEVMQNKLAVTNQTNQLKYLSMKISVLSGL